MGLVRPRGAFVTNDGFDWPTVLGPSDILEDDHPAVVAHPGSFEPVRATIPTPVTPPAGDQRARKRA